MAALPWPCPKGWGLPRFVARRPSRRPPCPAMAAGRARPPRAGMASSASTAATRPAARACAFVLIANFEQGPANKAIFNHPHLRAAKATDRPPAPIGRGIQPAWPAPPPAPPTRPARKSPRPPAPAGRPGFARRRWQNAGRARWRAAPPLTAALLAGGGAGKWRGGAGHGRMPAKRWPPMRAGRPCPAPTASAARWRPFIEGA